MACMRKVVKVVQAERGMGNNKNLVFWFLSQMFEIFNIIHLGGVVLFSL